jgi:hypothetical protein
MTKHPSATPAPSSWTPDQLRRKEIVEAGGTVVVSMRTRNGRGVDGALIKWAKESGRFERIDRGYPYGNPHHLDRERDRDLVVEAFRKYVTRHPALMQQLPSLQGKVLGCWCYPKRCHGDVLVDLLNNTTA